MQLTRRLDKDHDITFGLGLANFTKDAEATAQNIRTRLMLLQGEWFMDTDAGLPYLQRFAQKPTDLAYAESVIKKTILETEGVKALAAFSMVFDGNTRQLVVQATVTTIYADISDIQVRL